MQGLLKQNYARVVFFLQWNTNLGLFFGFSLLCNSVNSGLVHVTAPPREHAHIVYASMNTSACVSIRAQRPEVLTEICTHKHKSALMGLTDVCECIKEVVDLVLSHLCGYLMPYLMIACFWNMPYLKDVMPLLWMSKYLIELRNVMPTTDLVLVLNVQWLLSSCPNQQEPVLSTIYSIAT